MAGSRPVCLYCTACREGEREDRLRRRLLLSEMPARVLVDPTPARAVTGQSLGMRYGTVPVGTEPRIGYGFPTDSLQLFCA
mgnify:CR=1 FL=1